jgi:hypothetical protein
MTELAEGGGDEALSQDDQRHHPDQEERPEPDDLIRQAQYSQCLLLVASECLQAFRGPGGAGKENR